MMQIVSDVKDFFMKYLSFHLTTYTRVSTQGQKIFLSFFSNDVKTALRNRVLFKFFAKPQGFSVESVMCSFSRPAHLLYRLFRRTRTIKKLIGRGKIHEFKSSGYHKNYHAPHKEIVFN